VGKGSNLIFGSSFCRVSSERLLIPQPGRRAHRSWGCPQGGTPGQPDQAKQAKQNSGSGKNPAQGDESKKDGQQGEATAGESSAGGMHKGAGGGDPNSGSAADYREDDAPAGWRGLSQAQRSRLRSVGRVIRAAEMQLRRGEVAPSLLRKLEMTHGQYASLVERYTKRFERTIPRTDRTNRPGKLVANAFKLNNVAAGQRVERDRRRIGRVRGGEKLTADQLRGLYESRAARVSRDFRKHVEAYFRAISDSTSSTAQAPAAAK